jgi:nucleotide-binding universal stress UspA family protein
MYERILVPLDGSLRAERALPVAAHLARAGSGEIILTRVVTLPNSLGREEQPPTAEAILAGERETAIRYVKDVSQRLELAGVRTQIEARVAPAVAPALVDIIQTVHADLVIICSHGRTGLQRWALGSVAQKIARHATVPTLVLRADGPDLMSATGEGPRALRALVPLDGSLEAEIALEPTARLVSALTAPGQSALQLLYVVRLEDANDMAPNAKESLKKEAEIYLRRVAMRLTRELSASLAVTVTWSVVFDADVAAAILDQGADHRYDMIAMASHGRSGFQLWALGSIMERVLQTAALPLLILRSDSAATQRDTREAEEHEAGPDEMSKWPGYEPTLPPTKTPGR